MNCHLDLHRPFRERELEQAMRYIPPGSAVLDLGAGAGWQARRLAEEGLDVSAIDLETSEYGGVQVFPVRPYDGRRIPFPADSFDVVFTAHVLEHVPHVGALQEEIHRVLRPGGRAVHVLPTATWRIWTSVTHYPALVMWLLDAWRETRDAPLREHLRMIRRKLRFHRLPPRHGERGTFLTESYFFSRRFWVPFFRSSGWRVVERRPCGVYSSGNLLLARFLGMRVRESLSRVLGSSAMLYVLRPEGGSRAAARERGEGSATEAELSRGRG